MRKGKQFVMILHTQNGVIIWHTNKSKEIQEWQDTYTSNDNAIELTVYQRNGLGYEQVVHEHKRRIGF